MQVGVIFPQLDIGADPGPVRDYAQGVEGLGFTHITAFDQVVGLDRRHFERWPYVHDHEDLFHEVFVLFGFLAGLTSRIGLATGVLVLPQRQTALVAKQAAEVDVLSGGRLRLGIGVGIKPEEFEALEIAYPRRGRRCEEQMALMRALWTNELVDFEGEWHRVRHGGINPLPVQRPIPIWIGGHSPPVLDRIARSADGWMPNFEPDEEGAAIVARLHERARAHGRSTPRTSDSTPHRQRARPHPGAVARGRPRLACARGDPPLRQHHAGGVGLLEAFAGMWSKAEGESFLAGSSVSTPTSRARQVGSPPILDEVQREPDLLLAVNAGRGAPAPEAGASSSPARPIAPDAPCFGDPGRRGYVNLWPMTRRERLGLGATGIWTEILSLPPSEWPALVDSPPRESRLEGRSPPERHPVRRASKGSTATSLVSRARPPDHGGNRQSRGLPAPDACRVACASARWSTRRG